MDLIRLVAHRDELRPLGRVAVGPQVLGEALRGEIDHRVRGGENRLRGAIIALERDHARGRAEFAGEIQNIAHRRRPERIDRLGVVAHHGEAASIGFQREQDRGLQPIGVLVFVD